jgi:hypothetical protein
VRGVTVGHQVSYARAFPGQGTPSGGGSPPDAQADAHWAVYNHAGIGAFNYPINAAPASDWLMMRFVPRTTGTIVTVHVNFKWSSGYGAGTGGTARVGIHSISPTTGLSTGLIGSSGDIAMSGVVSTGATPGITVSAAVTAGTVYGIYITNVDGSPSTNWFSVNLCHVRKLATENYTNVLTNPIYGDGMTRHGLDPRSVNVLAPGGSGDFGKPEDGDGSTIPSYWLVYASGPAQGQPYLNASPTAFAVPTSRTYTNPYACTARYILAHGSGRSSAGQGAAISYTADVWVNGVEVRSNIAIAGTHGILAPITPLVLAANDTVMITASNTTGICAPYLDAAVMTLTGMPRSILPVCLAG